MAKTATIEEEVREVHAPPRIKMPERAQGSSGAPSSRRYPKIVAGICESCGVMDKSKPGGIQYTLCPHFREMGPLACSYCPSTLDPADVIAHKYFNVADHPSNPDAVVCWCSNGPMNPGGECENKHLKRFTPSEI